MREVDLNKKVAQWISKHGWAHKRIATPGRAGEPDVTGSILGIRIEIEGKLPGEEPTKLQYAKLKQWKKAGAITGWYTGVWEAQQIVIDGLKEKLEYTIDNHVKLALLVEKMESEIKQK